MRSFTLWNDSVGAPLYVVLNELPDLQARIQVALFSILQEKEIQVRGFKLRLPLEIQFIFSQSRGLHK